MNTGRRWKKTERRTILRIIDPHVHVWKNDPAFPWPVCLKNTTYEEALRAVRDEMKFIAPGDLEWVMCKTVLRLWPFGEEKPM